MERLTTWTKDEDYSKKSQTNAHPLRSTHNLTPKDCGKRHDEQRQRVVSSRRNGQWQEWKREVISNPHNRQQRRADSNPEDGPWCQSMSAKDQQPANQQNRESQQRTDSKELPDTHSTATTKRLDERVAQRQSKHGPDDSPHA